MGIFNKSKKIIKDRTILSPMTGEVFDLTRSAAPIYSLAIMGPGALIIPDEGRVLAAFDGVISFISEGSHMVSLERKDGINFLVHIGTGTVGLKGEGFFSHVKVGQEVKRGDILIDFDLGFLKDKKICLLSPAIITSKNIKKVEILKRNERIRALDELFRI